MIVFLTIFSLLAAGCSAQGGGWLESAAGNGKASFGFSVTCNELDPYTIEVGGPVQYNDMAAGINLHGDVYRMITRSTPISCADPMFPVPVLYGSYTMRPDGETGIFYVRFNDAGEGGPSVNDYFEIRIWEGADLSSPQLYFNSGLLGGGNIQIR